ncbi:hypothetical protein IKF12_03260 [Candidatus Saccharibacteria bacterium]|nr:hypothetical protein [Candidatus Saccharibacteria bacterium]
MEQGNNMQTVIVSGDLQEPVVVQEHNKGKLIWIVMAFIAIVTVIVVVILVSVLNNKDDGKATLIVKVVPESASVYIEEGEFKNGVYKIEPRESVGAVVWAEGFEPQTFRFDAKPGKEVLVATFLTGENDEMSYYKDSKNYDDLYLLWEYFCTYTDVGQQWYLAQKNEGKLMVDKSSLEGEEKLLYDFLIGI